MSRPRRSSKDAPQALPAAITVFRRYVLKTMTSKMFGHVPERVGAMRQNPAVLAQPGVAS
jgi:hypothetical protein